MNTNELKTEYYAARKAWLDHHFSDLNPMQRQAVLATEGPVLILAGAAVIVIVLAASAVSRKNRKHRKRAKAKTVQREEKADTGYRPRH